MSFLPAVPSCLVAVWINNSIDSINGDGKTIRRAIQEKHNAVLQRNSSCRAPSIIRRAFAFKRSKTPSVMHSLLLLLRIFCFCFCFCFLNKEIVRARLYVLCISCIDIVRIKHQKFDVSNPRTADRGQTEFVQPYNLCFWDWRALKTFTFRFTSMTGFQLVKPSLNNEVKCSASSGSNRLLYHHLGLGQTFRLDEINSFNFSRNIFYCPNQSNFFGRRLFFIF